MGDLIKCPELKRPVAKAEGFYTASQVSRLAMVPMGTLLGWREGKIIEPTLELVEDDKVIGEGYSYADLTIVRMLRALREGRLDLTSAGIALAHLYDRFGPPSAGWADARVYIVGKQIFAEKPDEWGVTLATQYGQRVETRLFGDLFEHLGELEPDQSIVVPHEYWGYVNIEPAVMAGAPTLARTRIPTRTIAQLAQQGRTVEQLALLYSPVVSRFKNLRTYIRKAIEYEHLLDRDITIAQA